MRGQEDSLALRHARAIMKANKPGEGTMRNFAGRVAVITGGASGIGLALARRLGAEGMKLVLADIDRPALEAAEAELKAAGRDVLACRTDVSRAEEIQALA